MDLFKLVSKHQPQGDQPAAIKQIVQNIADGAKHQVLLGATGTGKTFTMANIIAQLNQPALVLAHNKTLAAQLYSEFKELFPENAVEYFVSYYDYYQPEAYIPSSDTFIEKDSAINDEIDKLRHSATRSLFERSDVIIVASVSCIYGLGSPDSYGKMQIALKVGEKVERNQLLRKFVDILYERNDIDFHRGTFRVRGDVVEIFPSYEGDYAVRIEFFGDEIEGLSMIDPLLGKKVRPLDEINIYPKSHYVTTPDNLKRAIKTIQEELALRLVEYKKNQRLLEAQRIEQRTLYDIEMLEQLGFCNGVENYSRHFTGFQAGEPPPTLFNYFPKDYLLFVDESHVSIPQVGAMFRGDRARKETLVEFGFRLPSALDNRPLNFQEFEAGMGTCVYVSATPGDWEYQKSQGLVVEQIIRPTFLLDPVIEIKSAQNQVEDSLLEVKATIAQGMRVLITTLTKKMAEDLSEYLQSQKLKVKYLHSDIHTLERFEIIRSLRQGEIDIIVGINLLREGLDIPEVGLVCIMDADKEGFLRSSRSLIQIVGRAARNVLGRVIFYADKITDSMQKCIEETNRRRTIQQNYNQTYGTQPVTITKKIADSLVLEDTSNELENNSKSSSRSGNKSKQKNNSGNILQKIIVDEQQLHELIENPKLLKKQINQMTSEMKKAADDLDFELAAKIRDEVKRLSQMYIKIGGIE